tara:strand:- start:152 stop:1003 length:852 start_codon:yes stop_codon:yes gene_type:complete
MTGFAHKSVETEFGTLTWEVRTLNHRYLDVQFKLPNVFNSKEQDFRKQVSKTLTRGKVECNLYFQKTVDKTTDMQIDNDLFEILSARIYEVSKKLATKSVNPIELLRWPGLIKPMELDAKPLHQSASLLFSDILSSISEMRLSEGERIAKVLNSRCDEIAIITKLVRKRIPTVLSDSRIKQQERLKKLNVEANPERLEMELALFSQRIDIDEEIDRLESHIVEIRDAIFNKKVVGRRLDFLMQELNREANTLGSKSADVETTKASVNLKVVIEKMREQIQNVE